MDPPLRLHSLPVTGTTWGAENIERLGKECIQVWVKRQAQLVIERHRYERGVVNRIQKVGVVVYLEALSALWLIGLSQPLALALSHDVVVKTLAVRVGLVPSGFSPWEERRESDSLLLQLGLQCLFEGDGAVRNTIGRLYRPMIEHFERKFVLEGCVTNPWKKGRVLIPAPIQSANK